MNDKQVAELFIEQHVLQPSQADDVLNEASMNGKTIAQAMVDSGFVDEEGFYQTIAGALGENCTNRIGQTTLEELISELRNCRALLTNDTGTMHLAALLGVPVVAIFGSTEPALTGPLGNEHRIVRRHVECSPCFLRECPIDFRCMKEVTTQQVIDAMMSILQ